MDNFSPDPLSPRDLVRLPLSYDHRDPLEESKGEGVEAAADTVRALYQAPEIDRPKVFNRLVHQMRKLSFGRLLDLFMEIGYCALELTKTKTIRSVNIIRVFSL